MDATQSRGSGEVWYSSGERTCFITDYPSHERLLRHTSVTYTPPRKPTHRHRPHSRRRLHRGRAPHQCRPHPADTGVADWDTAILLAELGLGHAVVPALPDRHGADHNSVRLIPLPALPALSAGWAVRRWDALSPLARVFADTVTRKCAEMPGALVDRT
ncbi:LysR substrate-binding domain-containing protein [Streptomyces sp. DT203]|uniref:LysR substrate-binding domain-containing protein n=1 Tax=Streptomyces sp. DT203 TaxID=3393424 RepID=UPI003CF85942